MTTYTTAAKLREQERATAEGQKKIRQLQAEFQQAREDYDMKLTNLLKEHQEEVSGISILCNLFFCVLFFSTYSEAYVIILAGYGRRNNRNKSIQSNRDIQSEEHKNFSFSKTSDCMNIEVM